MNMYYEFNEEKERAIQKNENLIATLEYKRNSFCGIGTNKAKRRLNKFIKEDYIAAWLRLALEAEDKNIVAKKTYGQYRDKVYESKYNLIKELYELSIKNGVMCGVQKAEGRLTSNIIYFNTPITKAQISWHINLAKNDNFVGYKEKWDGLINTTLDKLEVDITQYLSSKKLLEDSIKNEKTLS